jgi:hypothetical protein
MKVFVVMYYGRWNEGNRIAGVFSTERLGEAYINDPKQLDVRDDLVLENWTLDEPE